MLEWLESCAVGQGVLEVVVHAQAYLERFYARRGYTVDGPPFEEDGIQHLRMTKTLAAVANVTGPAAAPTRNTEEE